jgi:hypothetical protein
MTIHWKVLEVHFLMVPLVFQLELGTRMHDIIPGFLIFKVTEVKVQNILQSLLVL